MIVIILIVLLSDILEEVILKKLIGNYVYGIRIILNIIIAVFLLNPVFKKDTLKNK